MRKKFPHCCLNGDWFLREYTVTLYNSVWPSVLASTMDFGSSSLKTNHRSPTIRLIMIPSNSLWRLHSDFLCFWSAAVHACVKSLITICTGQSAFHQKYVYTSSTSLLQQRSLTTERMVCSVMKLLKFKARMFDVVCIMEYCSHL